ncbi:UNVERIFIED_CONTAM: hypothetical protein PYX00_009753 [Menopon gallinae]|uniref:Ubiquitin-like protease family profile domain-containing protein n=1 Tax=Menopon gallinae TaxID=328185 RepID=A0AAW2HCH6_9NEOP
MFSAIYNYIHCKLFSKPVIGRKRRIEECNESPPKKYIRVDGKNIFNRADTSVNFKNLMESKENCHYDEDDDEGCHIVAEIKNKNWGTLPSSMARKSIRKSQCNSDTSLQAGNSKSDVSKTIESIDLECEPYESSTKDIEVVKDLTNSTLKKSAGELKGKTVSHRIFKSYRAPDRNLCNLSKNRTSFQNNMKQRLNFLRESYRLTEKYQYSQLLQSLTTRTSTLFSTTAPKPGCQKISKTSIPLIDLTKDKCSVTVNRTREDIPWTSRRGDVDRTSSRDKNEIPRVNSFQEYIKTNPVTDEDVVEQILSRHTKASAEKRKQAAIEAAKLQVLSDSNRKAYDEVLEERLRTYMKITTPVILEDDLEEEQVYKLPSLTPEQESQINKALVPTPPGQILVEKFGLQIKRRDMQTLKGLNWLNDEVVNFYMNLIMERGKNSKLPKVYAFNTFFYPKLISSGHASLKRWTKKVDIFSYDMVLVPVHLRMHWCMSLIDFRSKEVRYYDSMGSSNNICLQALLTYLEDESLDKRKIPYSTSDWRKKNVEDIPQQMNGSDCGVFSCMFAEHLSRDTPILFTQDNMPYFRRKMVLEILEGKLLT